MIIAFGHQRRRGKDTAARFLETALKIHNPKYPIKKKSFATSLKANCHQLYAWAGLHDGVYYENHPEEREKILPMLGKSPRDIWIDFGCAVRDHVFTDTFAGKVVKTCFQNEISIITDLRFFNEFKLIKELGGVCIKIERPDLPIPTDAADTALDSCTEWDHTIMNNGSLVDLSESITKVITKFEILKRML